MGGDFKPSCVALTLVLTLEARHRLAFAKEKQSGGVLKMSQTARQSNVFYSLNGVSCRCELKRPLTPESI